MINHLAYHLNSNLFERTKTVIIDQHSQKRTGYELSNEVKELQSVIMQYNTEASLNNKVMLLGQNSYKWVVSFLALLEMGFEVHLVHPNTSQSELQRILIMEDISIAIIDNTLEIMQDTKFARNMLSLGIYMQDNTVFHNELDLRPFTGFLRRRDINYYVVHHVGVESPAERSKVAYRDIKNIINGLADIKSWYSNSKKWVIGESLYRLPVLFVLYAILHKYLLVFIDASSSATHLARKIKNNPDATIWLYHRDFLSIWDKYFSAFDSKIVQNLLGYKLTKFFVKIWLKSRLNKVLGEPEEVVITASSIPLHIEHLLKEVSFPITITYGAKEFGSIVTYNNPQIRKIGTVGKQIVHGLITSKDVLHLDNSGELIFLGRSNSMLTKTLSLEILEVTVMGSTLIKEAIAVKKDKKVRIFVYPNIALMTIYGINWKDLKKSILKILEEVKNIYDSNEVIIDNIIIFTQPFLKTADGHLKRWAYQWK